MSNYFHLATAGMAFAVFASAASAQDAVIDSFYQGQVFELRAGIVAPQNTLQDTLTVRNNRTTQTQTTDVLDFGVGPRLDIGYSRPWGNNARMVLNLSDAISTGNTALQFGRPREAFPGTFDDDHGLPRNGSGDVATVTQTAKLTIGREWTLGDQWRVSAGLQAANASQDMSANIYRSNGNIARRLETVSDNTMYGVFGGASYYTPINDTYALRISGTVGVLSNDFTYNYTNYNRRDVLQQDVSGSSSGTAYSAQIAARIERPVTDHSMMTFEVGYEGLAGIGNGIDTFLDVDGTGTEPHIDSDMIGTVYISAGYALRF